MLENRIWKYILTRSHTDYMKHTLFLAFSYLYCKLHSNPCSSIDKMKLTPYFLLLHFLWRENIPFSLFFSLSWFESHTLYLVFSFKHKTAKCEEFSPGVETWTNQMQQLVFHIFIVKRTIIHDLPIHRLPATVNLFTTTPWTMLFYPLTCASCFIIPAESMQRVIR